MSGDERPLLLGLDLGTTAVKAAVYELDGTSRGAAAREYGLVSGPDGAVEVAAATCWQAMVDAVHALSANPALDMRRVDALALSCQGETLLPLNSGGEPLRDAIVWLDTRAGLESTELADAFDPLAFYEITGQPQMLPTWPAAKLRWLARNEPALFAATDKFALLEDYVILRMTGEFVTEGSLATSTCYWDFRKKTWWPEMLDAIGLEVGTLPTIVEPGTRVARLLPEAADELGLRRDTWVCTGALDQACGAVGVGNVRPGRLSENTGAAVAMCATVDGPTLDPQLRIPCHYHGVADTYMLHTFTSGGVVLQWLRDQLGESERAVARNLAVDSYDLLGQEAGRVTPGCDGLLAIPHFQGAMAPESNANARGAFVGLSLSHERAHLVRAIMEAVVYVIRRNVEVFGELQAPPSELWALGGGARSPVWKQIEADVLQLPVTVTTHRDAATLGAAMLAGAATGHYEHVEEAATNMVRAGTVYEPSPALRDIYDEGYGRYRDAYEALCPVFDRIAARR